MNRPSSPSLGAIFCKDLRKSMLTPAFNLLYSDGTMTQLRDLMWSSQRV